jgi:hypothetical protein
MQPTSLRSWGTQAPKQQSFGLGCASRLHRSAADVECWALYSEKSAEDSNMKLPFLVQGTAE